MSTTSSTRRGPTNSKTNSSGVHILPPATSTRPSLQETSRFSSTNLTRPTASSTSKANTPLLQPKRPLQPAHIRHLKSNSCSSISKETMSHISLSGTPQYINIEAENQYLSGSTSRSSKPQTNFHSRIPVRTTNSNMSSSNRSSSNNGSLSTRSTVLQPKASLATVSSNGSSATKSTKATLGTTLGKTQSGSSSSISKPPALVLKTNSNRIQPHIKPPLPLNKTSSSSVNTLKKKTSATQLSSSSRLSTSATKTTDGFKNGTKAASDDRSKNISHQKTLSSSSGSGTSININTNINKKSISGTSMSKSHLSNGSSKIRLANGGIQPSPKSPAVNGIVNNPVASLKPTLPLKTTARVSSGLYSKSTSNLTNSSNGYSNQKTSASVSNTGHSLTPKLSSKVSGSSGLSKLHSTSRSPLVSDSNIPSLKATSESNIKLPKSSSFTINKAANKAANKVGDCEFSSNRLRSTSKTSDLVRKSGLSQSFTPRAVPKEFSQIPSPPVPPVSSQLSQLKRGSSINGSQTFRKTNLHSPMSKHIDRAPSAVSLSSNYFTDPLLPEEVLKTFGSKLSPYEHKEILEYPRVYYFGANTKRFHSRDRHTKPFSTQEGDLLFETSDHLAYRYEIQKVLGKGSFGQVVRAYDYKFGRDVAIKIIRNSERFHRQALTEIQLLEALTRWDKDGEYHVLHILENFFFRGHLCIVTELYGINLYEYIKQNQFAGFRLPVVRNFASQILKCLSLLYSHNVIHCDLKPENILLAGPTNSSVKVIDFGSSCFTSQRIYTYIQSRFYRSPEVILELPYGPAIDMWSFGCILAELSNGHPIFPGETEAEQMACILEVLGFPDPALLAKSRRRYSFFDVAGNPRPSLSPRRRRVVGSKPLSKALKTNDEQFVDFVSKCLEFSPDKRITPDEALNHPWIVGDRPIARSSSIATNSFYSRHRSLLTDPLDSSRSNQSDLSSVKSCVFSDLETDNITLHSNDSSEHSILS